MTEQGEVVARGDAVAIDEFFRRHLELEPAVALGVRPLLQEVARQRRRARGAPAAPPDREREVRVAVVIERDDAQSRARPAPARASPLWWSCLSRPCRRLRSSWTLLRTRQTCSSVDGVRAVRKAGRRRAQRNGVGAGRPTIASVVWKSNAVADGVATSNRNRHRLSYNGTARSYSCWITRRGCYGLRESPPPGQAAEDRGGISRSRCRRMARRASTRPVSRRARVRLTLIPDVREPELARVPAAWACEALREPGRCRSPRVLAGQGDTCQP